MCRNTQTMEISSQEKNKITKEPGESKKCTKEMPFVHQYNNILFVQFVLIQDSDHVVFTSEESS